MKQAFLNHSIQMITKYNNTYSDEDIEKLKYGLEGIYLTFTKLIIIVILSIVLGIWKEMIVVLILFNIIRFPAFGFHANNSITCLLFSIFLFLGLTYCMVHIHISFNMKIIISLICLFHYIVFAPADTPKRPLTNKKKRQIRKFFSILLAFIYILTSFIITDETISVLILTALVIEAIMISPITYKIFHQTFHNYKSYVSY